MGTEYSFFLDTKEYVIKTIFLVFLGIILAAAIYEGISQSEKHRFKRIMQCLIAGFFFLSAAILTYRTMKLLRISLERPPSPWVIINSLGIELPQKKIFISWIDVEKVRLMRRLRRWRIDILRYNKEPIAINEELNVSKQEVFNIIHNHFPKGE